MDPLRRHRGAPATQRTQRGRASGISRSLVLIGTLVLLLAAVLPPGALHASQSQVERASEPVTAASAATLTLEVEDVGGTPLDNASYEWRIDVDDTGDPRNTPANRDACFPATNPAYPAGCPWPSVHTFTGGAGDADNLVTQGGGTELNETNGLDLSLFPVDPDHPADPNFNKFLVSVVADGHKIGGAHFALPIDEPGRVIVRLHPDPLPFSTILIQVFEDTSPNGEFDAITEGPPEPSGPNEFEAHISDVLGEVTTDWYGNPICGRYADPADGDSYVAGSGGRCVDDNGDGIDTPEDHDGIIEIPNLGSNRYSAGLSGSLDFDRFVSTRTTAIGP